ncbi:uncharacterized protein LOC144565012 [Carex rostrata]
MGYVDGEAGLGAWRYRRTRDPMLLLIDESTEGQEYGMVIPEKRNRMMKNRKRDATVASLVNLATGSWDAQVVTELLGVDAMQVYEDITNEALGKIWTWKGILPRVRTFLWRAIHGALPTAAWLHARIRDINPVCKRCRAENEYLMHLFYYCPVSQATWQAAGLTLNVDDLPLNFTKTLLTVTQTMDERQTVNYCNLLWEVWKARNREVFEGKKTQPLGILKQAKSMEQAVTTPSSNLTRTRVILNRIPRGAKTILIDASWEPSNKTGTTAVMVFDEQGGLLEALSQAMVTNDSFQAEAIALLQALQYVESNSTHTSRCPYVIFSDCKTLVQTVNQQCVDELPSWKARQTIAQCIVIWEQVLHTTSLYHTRREALTQPHLLANGIRKANSGSTGMELVRELGIDLQLLSQFFVFQ